VTETQKETSVRKLLTAAALIFVLAFAIAAALPAPAQAADCYYSCDCAGRVIRCCVTSTGVSCKLVTGPAPIACPQVYNC
jgi:hypothetical protein